jgi:hypothetical protein
MQLLAKDDHTESNRAAQLLEHFSKIN